MRRRVTVGTSVRMLSTSRYANRDAQLVHLTLDELIRAVQDVRNELGEMESLPDEALNTRVALSANS